MREENKNEIVAQMRARGGNAPGTQDPAEAPADLGTERGTSPAESPDARLAPHSGAGGLGDSAVTGQEDGPGTSGGNSATDADKTGPRSGPGS